MTASNILMRDFRFMFPWKHNVGIWAAKSRMKFAMSGRRRRENSGS